MIAVTIDGAVLWSVVLQGPSESLEVILPLLCCMLVWASKDVEVVFVRCRTSRAVVVFLITSLSLFPSCAKETVASLTDIRSP